MYKNWHAHDIEKVLAKLEVGQKGLTWDQVQARRKKYGQNILPQKEHFSKTKIFF